MRERTKRHVNSRRLVKQRPNSGQLTGLLCGRGDRFVHGGFLLVADEVGALCACRWDGNQSSAKRLESEREGECASVQDGIQPGCIAPDSNASQPSWIATAHEGHEGPASIKS